MSRRHVHVDVPAIALRLDEAAAACAVSVETFNAHVRPHVPAARVGGVVVYPVAGLTAFLERHATAPVDDLARRRAA